MKLVALLVAVAFFMSPAFAFAAPAACSCKHLEALQQELENALYLAEFQADLSRKVKKAEDDQRELKKNDPRNPLAKYPVMWASELEWSKEKAKVSLPHPAVTGYTGPNSIPIITGTCKNDPEELKKLKNGVSCAEIGTIILKHEQEHRDICTQMGKEKYWDRLYSEIAAEEAERYREQARAMRALLKKVIDGSTVKVSEETTLKITAPGPTEYNYKLSMPAFKLSGKSSEGNDEWELKGTGTRSVGITSMKIPGLTCTPTSQKLTSKVTGTLTLDGLKMKLNQESVTNGGTISVTCKAPGGQGTGIGIAPPGETGSGEVFKKARVKLQSEFTEDVGKTSWGKAISGTGVTASGTSTTKVTITCQ